MPVSSLHQPSIRDARENIPSSSHGTGRVSFLRIHTGSRPPHYMVCFRHVGGVSSDLPACNCTPTRHPNLAENILANRLIRKFTEKIMIDAVQVPPQSLI